MAPLTNLAVSLLPGLAKRVVDDVLPDVEAKITRAVRDVIGTDDPDRAAERIADPKVAAELRLRLAEIEAQADAREVESRQKAHEAELAAIRRELEGFRGGSTQTSDLSNPTMFYRLLNRYISVWIWSIILAGALSVGFNLARPPIANFGSVGLVLAPFYVVAVGAIILCFRSLYQYLHYFLIPAILGGEVEFDRGKIRAPFFYLSRSVLMLIVALALTLVLNLSLALAETFLRQVMFW